MSKAPTTEQLLNNPELAALQNMIYDGTTPDGPRDALCFHVFTPSFGCVHLPEIASNESNFLALTILVAF